MKRRKSEPRHRIDRDELLARVDLVAVLDAFTPATGSGRTRRWRCPEPSHPDEHPSVTVSRDQRGVDRWRCWSGGHGGTAIDAVVAARHLSVGESIRWLNEHYAHLEPLPQRPHREVHPRSDGRPSPEVVQHVERCEKQLWTWSGREIRSWLNARGLTDDVLVGNRVGADPGLVLGGGKRLPDGTLAAVFPALDPSGNITYFQSRFIDPATGSPKYANPPRHLAKNPGLAWTQATAPVRSNTSIVIAEGIPDALIAASAGMRSVGVLGAMTPNHRIAERLVKGAANLADPHPGFVICFDADPPGRSGAEHLLELLNEHTSVPIADVSPPEGMDLTDWSGSGGDWTNRLARSASDPAQSPDPDFDLGP